MKIYPPCQSCRRAMTGYLPAPAGMVHYGARGICATCQRRQLRHGTTDVEPALPFDARPWVEQAACATVDPDLFFPENGGSSPGQVRAAKAVCRRCPVTAECLAYALANDEVFGIFGGLSVRERQRLGRRGAA